ncbi:MAG: hypothetical protein JWR32_1995 [Mycobacterium sp.]|jgi:prolyl 4-hydroxylase|nr:hypothetical protein [Mycobacterium sp.]
MTVTMLQPGAIACLDDMLSAAECAEIAEELQFAWWWDSPLVQIRPNGVQVSRRSYRRTSRTTSEQWMGEHTLRLLRRLEDDLHHQVGLRPNHLEHWQAARYRRGERFDEHHDAGFFGSDPRGERTTSVVVYLDSQPSGGAIYFPALRLRIQPRPGRAVVWPNLLPDASPDPRMRHVACPARRGKTTLTVWERQRPTRNTAARRR